MTTWDHISVAVRMIQEGHVDRIDGDGWKVYRAGTIVRIDLAEDFKP